MLESSVLSYQEGALLILDADNVLLLVMQAVRSEAEEAASRAESRGKSVSI